MLQDIGENINISPNSIPAFLVNNPGILVLELLKWVISIDGCDF
jgi:hypothetical protein